MYPMVAQQQPSIGPTSLTVSLPRQHGAGHYRGDPPPPSHGMLKDCTNVFNAGPATAQ